MPTILFRSSLPFALLLLISTAFFTGCAHRDIPSGDFRGKYVKAGFMMNDSALRTEIVLTNRGEVFTLLPTTGYFEKKDQLPRLKTKATFFAVEKTGILEDHTNRRGFASTFYLEYHKRSKVYTWTWGEIGWPQEVRDVYQDMESLKK